MMKIFKHWLIQKLLKWSKILDIEQAIRTAYHRGAEENEKKHDRRAIWDPTIYGQVVPQVQVARHSDPLKDPKYIERIRTRDLPTFRPVQLREIIQMRKAEPCDPFLVQPPSEETVHNMEAVRERHTRKLG